MVASMKARLIIIVLAGTAASLAAADDLRGPETFASIANQAERSRALFVEAGRVLQHPRCLNCHPVGERPTQGNHGHSHFPLVVRGPGGVGGLLGQERIEATCRGRGLSVIRRALPRAGP